VVHLRQAAFQRHVDAMLLLGRCVRDGVGTDSDTNEAFFWLERAAFAGSGAAQLDLAKMLLARGKEELDDAIKWLKQAASNGVEEAAHELRAAMEKFGLNKPSQNDGKAPISSAHLDSEHELHEKNGRLRVTFIGIEGLPKVATPSTWGEKSEEKDLVYPRIYLEMVLGQAGECSHVKWARVVRRPRTSAAVNLNDIKEIGMWGNWIETTPVSAKPGTRWDMAFAAYINGSSGGWKVPLELQVYAKLGGWMRNTLIATGKIMPWEVPAGRSTRMRVDLHVHESCNVVMVESKACLLVEVRRSSAPLPEHMLETEEQRRLGQVFKWNIMQVPRSARCPQRCVAKGALCATILEEFQITRVMSSVIGPQHSDLTIAFSLAYTWFCPDRCQS
jgi:hypothetical protein